MDAAPAGRPGGPILQPPPAPPPQAAARKEWRAVSDGSFRSNGSDESEHGNLGQSDERTIYEEGAGTGTLDVDFCSITIDGSGGLSEDILQQRLHSVARQREELQQMEIELRAQAIAQPQILEAHASFEAQMKEQAAATTKLKEQLQEREKYIIELEMKLDEKDRELNALKIDNETAWAKEGLLREQNKELASFRRERDNSEAERTQHLKQIRDLQEHLREKESQFLALEEQHRVAQENILYKDEQLREAHSWLARVQEMDALHSTTNQSLQAELRERTEQFNQFWIGFQRQYAEMEQHHLQTIQQLQLELAEARGQTATQKDSSRAARDNAAESSHVKSNGNSMATNGSGTGDGNLVHNSNGSVDGSTKVEHASAVPVVPSSLLGLGGFLPSGQMTGMHPYMMHPQGIPQPLSSTNSAVLQLGNFQPLSTIPPNQRWPNQLEALDVSQTPNQTDYQQPQAYQSPLPSDANYNHELSAQRQVIHPEHLIAHGDQQQRSGNTIVELSHELKAMEPNGTRPLDPKEQQVDPKEPEDILTSNANSSTVALEQQEQRTETKDEGIIAAGNQSKELVSRQQKKAPNFAVPNAQSHYRSLSGVADFNSNVVNRSDTLRSAGSVSGSSGPSIPREPALLDERSLLACIVRAIPAGSDGRIRISTTLPNRLGKMLAPLHWHDYKKRYGKLDDFVANHPELFVIEGDFIHLQEGAQQIISATTAAAKVAAAAAASSAPYSSLLPSVAVTPVAQSIRQKRVHVVDSRSANTMSFVNGSATTNLGDPYDKHSQIMNVNDRQQTSVGFNIVQGVADVTISNKLKNLQENGFSSDIRPGQSSLHASVANGGKYERAGLPVHDKVVSNGRHGHGGKPQGRSSEAAYISRR